MADEIVTLAVYNNLMEAQMARNLLLAEGIGVQMTGETGGGLLPGMEGMFGHFQLLVSDADLEQAAAILGLDEQDEVPAEFEESEPPSTAIRAQGEASVRAAHEEEPPPSTSIRPRSPSDQPTRAEGSDTSAPPKELEGHEDELEEKLTRGFRVTADDLATRALRVAIIGLMLFSLVYAIFPCVILVLSAITLGYSVWLLARMATLAEDVSPAGMRRLYATLAVILATLVLAFIYLRFYLWWW